MYQTQIYNVRLKGLSPIMFDRYAGDNKTQLPPERKMYFAEDEKTLVLPSVNLMSFLTATNTPSAPRIIYDSREYKDICNALASFVAVEPFEIPITANGEPLVFEGWTRKIALDNAVARLKNGIPNQKSRPVVHLPWEIEFKLHYILNEQIAIRQIQDIFMQGGIRVGLGTFRPVYGKFCVDRWDVT